VGLEVVEKELDALADVAAVADARLIYVALLVRDVVLPTVRAAAWPAVAVATAAAALRSKSSTGFAS
jgi:hypothetical protein